MNLNRDTFLSKTKAILAELDGAVLEALSHPGDEASALRALEDWLAEKRRAGFEPLTLTLVSAARVFRQRPR